MTRPSVILGLSVGASVLVHIAAVGIVVSLYDHARGETADPRAIHHEDPPPPDDSNDPVLGIERSTAQTVTFIGYQEYQEHLARLSEVEQAAMREDQTPVAPTAEPEPEPKPEPEPEPELVPEPEPKPKPKSKPEPRPDPKPKPKEQKPAPKSDPIPPATKDATPTSTILVPRSKWRFGKPLAAEGLDLKTRRPSIPAGRDRWFRATAHPLAELVFLPSGKIDQARILQSSGDGELDAYLLAALYGWTASGEQISALKGDDRVVIRLRLLLN